MSPLISNPFMPFVNVAASERQSKPRVSNEPHCAQPTTPLPVFDITAPLSASVSPIPSNKPRESFAETLMNLLIGEEYSKIVTFLPDNQSFGIINSKVFADEVMPKVLGIRSFSSFVRKLHRWGFERIMEKKTHDVDVFRHHLFRKGDWASCRKVKCGGRQQEHELCAPQVIHPAPLTVRQQKFRRSNFLAESTNPTLPCSWRIASMHDVTSQVVGAALDVLRRDEEVIFPPDLRRIMVHQQHMQACLMALQHRHLLDLEASRRSSMTVL